MLTSTLYNATSSLWSGIQCAAVITMRGAMREPPQNGAYDVSILLLFTKPTMNSSAPSVSLPLIISCGCGGVLPSLPKFGTETRGAAPLLDFAFLLVSITSSAADAEMLPRRKTAAKSFMVIILCHGDALKRDRGEMHYAMVEMLVR